MTDRIVNQTSGESGFVRVGTYRFSGRSSERIELRNVDSPSTLFADAVQFTPIETSASGIIRIDNSDAGYSEESGVWSRSNLAGSFSSDSRSSATNNASARWDLGVFEPGDYQVQFYNVVDAANTTQARLEILHAGVITNVTVDQQSASNGYLNLGSFGFAGDGTESIRITNIAGGRIRTDAVRLIRISTSATSRQPGDGLDVPEDVNGDKQVTALDALRVINSLGTEQNTTPSEGESIERAVEMSPISTSDRDKVSREQWDARAVDDVISNGLF